MPKITFDRMDLNLVSSLKEPQGQTVNERPFNILVLGDFSGRANRGLVRPGSELLKQKIQPIDRDNFNAVMSKLNVELLLPQSDGPPLRFQFKNLDDFHPDALYAHHAVFKPLRELRLQAQDPGLFKMPVSEPCHHMQTNPGPNNSTPALSQKDSHAQTGLLDQIIDSNQEPAFQTGPHDRLDPQLHAFINQIVEPYAVPKSRPEQAEFMAELDQSIADMMREIMHHPYFQELESLWRGLAFLVNGLETDETLKIFMLDISKQELPADLIAHHDIADTVLYRLVVEASVGTPGAEPWTLMTGLYSFFTDHIDIDLLNRLAQLAQKAGAPFIAAAHDTWLGCASLAAAPYPGEWQLSLSSEILAARQELRNRPEAAYLGLVLPRFLLRLPYGAQTVPIESFAFEEFLSATNHHDYAWGNGALVCAYLLAQSFRSFGWDFRQQTCKELSGLPLHTYKINGENPAKPCAEILLTEQAVEEILAKGLMPLVSFRDQDKIRLPRFQSLAEPLKPLAGTWTCEHVNV